ncbi:MAG: multiheme c-type cytochrome [Proteobacteria bacterium]|nr:multiheme c-type cytochrome [Pseudomonadota bacterium]
MIGSFFIIHSRKFLAFFIGFIFLAAFALPLPGAEAQDSGATKHKGMQSMPKQMQHGADKAATSTDMKKPKMGGHAGGMKKPMMGGHGGGMAKFNKVKFEPSSTCKQCHETIVQEWSQSMHSRSRSAWYFSHKVASERMGMVCNNERNEAIACQTCHEPGGVYPFGDVIQKMPAAVASAEGVTCDICHRISEVKGTGEFSFGPMDTKLGPYKDSKSPYHKTLYSPLMESSEFCVACHGQLNNLNGLNVCDTTRSWRKSKYAKPGKDAKTCQSCHMPAFSGAAATGDAAPDDAPKNRTRHSHIFRGPNSDPTILMTAATLVQDVKRAANGDLHIEVKVTNSGTGHDLPSGLPERLITLKVTGKDASGKVVWENWEENVYEEDRMAAFGLYGFDPKGGEVPPMGASKIDNLSLQPDETRTLDYKLSKADSANIRSVEAKLTYHAARPEGIFYFGNQGLASVKPRPMTSVVTRVN